jgi:hypothetical protein
MKRKLLSIFLSMAIVVSASGCASPTVDMSALSFDEEKYDDDLNSCRGGSAATAFLGGLKGAAAGSLFGASEGATSGALAGNSGEGAIIGAIVGSVLGVFIGAYKPFQEKEESVRTCLQGKGYRVS